MKVSFSSRSPMANGDGSLFRKICAEQAGNRASEI